MSNIHSITSYPPMWVAPCSRAHNNSLKCTAKDWIPRKIQTEDGLWWSSSLPHPHSSKGLRNIHDNLRGISAAGEASWGQSRRIFSLTLSATPLCWCNTQDVAALLGCKNTLQAHVHLFTHQDPHVLLCRAALKEFFPQFVHIPGIAPPRCNTLRLPCWTSMG